MCSILENRPLTLCVASFFTFPDLVRVFRICTQYGFRDACLSVSAVPRKVWRLVSTKTCPRKCLPGGPKKNNVLGKDSLREESQNAMSSMRGAGFRPMGEMLVSTRSHGNPVDGLSRAPTYALAIVHR